MPDPGMNGRIYAVGDIHGRADLLDVLLAHIRKEGEGKRAIFLGDLIDRGPDSCAVLDMVAAHLRNGHGSHFILGNHDWFLREFLLDRLGAEDLQRWVDRYGALDMFRSYGIADPAVDWTGARRHILETWPAHRELLVAAGHCLVDGPLCFVHAGLRPGVPLAEQSAEDLMWIKADFLDHRKPFEHLVVHGHTPTASSLPEVFPNRIALDTHAFRSGHLTAAAFENGRLMHFLRTVVSADGGIVAEPLAVPA
ncbi:MAG: metallophosphoesterase [Mesorhizobium sp.]